MPIRRGSQEDLFSRQSSPYRANDGDEIAIGTDKNAAIKYIVDGVFEKGQAEMNVRLFFLVTLPGRATFIAPSAFFTKARHVAIDTNML